MLKKELGLEKGSPTSNREKVGKVTRAQLQKIAEIKMPDLNANDIDGAIKIMGVGPQAGSSAAANPAVRTNVQSHQPRVSGGRRGDR